MDIKGKRVGVAISASCCTYHKMKIKIRELMEAGAIVTVIVSQNVQEIDSRFGDSDTFIRELEEITGTEVKKSIVDVEPFGPKGLLDIILLAPCTGNTMAKLANAITDTSVTMSAKSMLRNHKPVVISLTTNDALGLNLRNLGTLMNTKNVYFVPMGQDSPQNKPHSLSANFDMILPTLEMALEGKQIQPVIVEYKH